MEDRDTIVLPAAASRPTGDRECQNCGEKLPADADACPDCGGA